MIDQNQSVANSWARILGPDVSVRGADEQSRSGENGASSARGDDAATSDPDGRTVEDIITLSDGARIVNLARGDQLSAEIRNERDPDKVREMVEAGRKDINRITRFFGEMFRTMMQGLGLR